MPQALQPCAHLHLTGSPVQASLLGDICAICFHSWSFSLPFSFYLTERNTRVWLSQETDIVNFQVLIVSLQFTLGLFCFILFLTLVQPIKDYFMFCLVLKSQLFVLLTLFYVFHIWCSETFFGLSISVNGYFSAIWEFLKHLFLQMLLLLYLLTELLYGRPWGPQSAVKYFAFGLTCKFKFFSSRSAGLKPFH